MKNYISAAKLAKIKSRFPAAEFDATQNQPAVYIGTEEFLALLDYLKTDLDFLQTRCVNATAIDWKTCFEAVYTLFSLAKNDYVTVKVKLDHDNPLMPSATAVFSGVEFEEREMYDLMGIKFTGHPDLRRILLADDFEGHPLRKDYKQLVPPPVRRLVRGE